MKSRLQVLRAIFLCWLTITTCLNVSAQLYVNDNQTISLRGPANTDAGLKFDENSETVRLSHTKDVYDRFISLGGYYFGTWNPQLTLNTKTGNVGIGTTSPSSMLTIKGDYGLNLEPLSNGPVNFYISSNSADNIIGVNARTKLGAWEIPDSSKPTSFLDFSTYNVNNPYYGGVAFYTRTAGASGIGTEKLVLLNNGNLGVGTTNPISEFQVNDGYQKISLGKISPQVGQYMGWAAQYIGLNVARNPTSWIASYDGGHNGGSIIIGDTFGQFRIVNIPSTGTADQTLTDSQINQNTRFSISSSGNVGIGLGAVPRCPLEVQVTGDNNSVQTGLIIQQTNTGSPNNKAGVSLDFGIGNNYANNNIEGRITLKETYWAQQPKMFFSLWDPNNNFQDRMVIDTNGKVGIGNTNPDAMLTVSGQVHAQEVKVTVNAPGPDYVFEKDYKLSSLEEIKNYIDQNKHLPEVPSAKEMEKNGVQLGVMNMLLLRKIEELTLYQIESNKRIVQLQKEIEEIKRR